MKMGEMKKYEQLTYIECYDGEIRTTIVWLDVIKKLLDEQQFLHLWNELINRGNIKRVFTRELSDVDKIICSIEDKNIRRLVQKDIEKRIKDWLRVNVEVVENLLSKYQ